MSAKPKIAVIGAGLMGHGIAQVFALAGHDVAITDAHRPTLDSALTRISPSISRAIMRTRLASLRALKSSDSWMALSSVSLIIYEYLSKYSYIRARRQRGQAARAVRMRRPAASRDVQQVMFRR